MSETPQVAPTVYDHLTLMLDQMVSVAWQKIGLHPDMVKEFLLLEDWLEVLDCGVILLLVAEPLTSTR